MSRWATVLGLAAVGGGALLVFSQVSGAPAIESPMPSQLGVSTGSRPATPSEAVRIEHELVVVQPPAVRAPQARPRPAATARGVAPAASQQSGPVRRGVVTRAGRMLVGDGQYRPEPFPRLDAGK